MKRKRTECYDNKTRLQTVPWFSKKEWAETYKNVYSKQKELQIKAYTQICIWKVRDPNLPLGVECTMSLLHVKICEQSSDIASKAEYKDKDLQLLYSTAVMRFLNHLSAMSNNKDSMYKVAEDHKIPDWVINLRHEAAHGNSVPALYLLRQAGDFILQWLKENYWEVEAKIMTDVIIDQAQQTEIVSKQIEELLDLWSVLKISQWTGHKTVNKIPSKHFRDCAVNLLKEEGGHVLQPVQAEVEEFCEENLTKDFEDMIVDKSETVKKDRNETTNQLNVKINYVCDLLLNRLFAPLRKKKDKEHYQECLISCLIKNKAFCPEKELDNIDESDSLQLISLLGELWKELLERLQSHNLLHCLLRALTLNDGQIPVTHLWLQFFACLFSGKLLSYLSTSESVLKTLALNLPCAIDLKKILETKLYHIKRNRPVSLKSSPEIEVVLQQLAKNVLENPTRFSTKYLYSLLFFWETPLSNKTIKKLSTLAQLYCGEARKLEEDSIHTVASLLDLGFDYKQSEDSLSKDTPQNKSSEGPWKLYTGNADWSRCALGILPWG